MLLVGRAVLSTAERTNECRLVVSPVQYLAFLTAIGSLQAAVAATPLSSPSGIRTKTWLSWHISGSGTPDSVLPFLHESGGTEQHLSVLLLSSVLSAQYTLLVSLYCAPRCGFPSMLSLPLPIQNTKEPFSLALLRFSKPQDTLSGKNHPLSIPLAPLFHSI